MENYCINNEIDDYFICNLNHDNAKSLLSTSIICGSIETARYIISTINLKIFNWDHLLNLAVVAGHLNMVELCIKSGLSNPANSDSMSLKIASTMGEKSIVKYLIEQGADPKASDSYSVLVASSNGHINTVELLLGHGAKLNNFALIWAFKNDRYEMVEYLIKKRGMSRDITRGVSSSRSNMYKIAYYIDNNDYCLKRSLGDKNITSLFKS